MTKSFNINIKKMLMSNFTYSSTSNVYVIVADSPAPSVKSAIFTMANNRVFEPAPAAAHPLNVGPPVTIAGQIPMLVTASS